MLNKFNKIIHIKNSRFFRFIFFIRFLIAIFLLSIVLFLTLPNFFNYEKRAKIIENYILTNYNFEIKNYETIRYRFFPLPRIEIRNVQFNPYLSASILNTKILKIYPKLLSIYNFQNFQTSKIILSDSNLNLDMAEIKFFLKKLFNKKKNFSFDNLNITLQNENKLILKISDTKFANFGYNKNIIKGKIFNQKFVIKIIDDYQNIKIKLLKSGVNADIKYFKNKKNNSLDGIFRSKILNTNLKFNFNYDGNQLNIFKSYFRSKNLSFSNESKILLNPYLEIKSEVIVEELKSEIIKKIDLFQILRFKDVLKKINNQNIIKFKSKKFGRYKIDDLELKTNLAYGRLIFSKKILISNDVFECEGNINFLEDFPILFFDCSMVLKDKQAFFKKFSIKTNGKKEIIKIYAKGNLNILNKKINFKSVSINENYIATKEDLKYFKTAFEKIFLNNSFYEVFDRKKIKDFILEIL